MNTAGTFFLVVFILLIVGIAGWVGFTQFRARRLGLPPPSWKSYIPFMGSTEPSPYGAPQPRRGGVMGWIEDRIAGLRQKRDRTAPGAYEQGRPLDPDDAWDPRIPGDQGYRNQGFYNENELEDGRGGRASGRPRGAPGGGGDNDGLVAPAHPYGGAGAGTGAPGGGGSYSGSGYQMNVARPVDDEEEEEPRGRSRSRDGRPNENPFGTSAVRHNPFDDDQDLPGVSTRPVVDTCAAAAQARQAKNNDAESESPRDRRSVFRENM